MPKSREQSPPKPDSREPSANPAPPSLPAGEPVTLRTIVFGSGPRFLRDGFGPVLGFYLGWKLGGLAVGIGLATAVALLAFRLAKREEREGNLVKLSLGLVVIQAVIGLASGSAKVYLAQPVLLNGALGVAFFVSAFTSRPIIGIFARETYPFPEEVKNSETFRRVFARASLVWGVYQLLRAGIRLAVLSQSSVDAYVAVNFATGVPMMSGMFAWTAWYSIRSFRRSQEWGWAFEAEPAPA